MDTFIYLMSTLQGILSACILPNDYTCTIFVGYHIPHVQACIV